MPVFVTLISPGQRDRRLAVGCSALLAALALTPSAARAAGASDAQRAQEEAQRIQQLQTQRERQSQEELDRALQRPSGADIPEPEHRPPPPGKGCFDIKTLTLKGATRISAARLAELRRKYTGRCIALSDIDVLMQELTHDYLVKGYVTTRVYVPEQDLSRGELTLLVIEGTVSDIRSRATEGKRAGISLATAFPHRKGRIFNLRDFEQGLDQINRLPANAATMTIEPAGKLGASVVVISNHRSRPWSLSATVDNSGSASTGQYQASVNLGLDDLLGLNDRFDLNARTNTNPDGKAHLSQDVGGNLSIPYGYWLLTLSGSDFRFASQTITSVSTLSSTGNTATYGAKLDRVMFRNGAVKWTLGADVSVRDIRNSLDGQILHTSSHKFATLGLSSNLTAKMAGGLLGLDLGVVRGVPVLGGAADVSGAGADVPRAQYTKLTFGATYSRLLLSRSLDISLQSSVSGQYAARALYGTDQILIGSLYSVRGFREHGLSQNSGWYARNEIGRSFFSSGVKGGAMIRPYLGFDVGHAYASHGAPGGTLAGMTAGVSMRIGGANVELAYSRPVHRTGGLAGEEPFGFFQVSGRF